MSVEGRKDHIWHDQGYDIMFKLCSFERWKWVEQGAEVSSGVTKVSSEEAQ